MARNKITNEIIFEQLLKMREEIKAEIKMLSRSVDALEQNLVSIRFELENKSAQASSNTTFANIEMAKQLVEFERLKSVK